MFTKLLCGLLAIQILKDLTDPKLLEDDIIAKDYSELNEKENEFIEAFSEVKNV